MIQSGQITFLGGHAGREALFLTRFSNDAFLESPDFPFHLALYEFKRGESVAPHSHEFIEFVYVYGGTGTHEYRGIGYPIREGDVFVIEPGAEHAYRAGSDKQPLEVYNILVAPALLRHEMEALFRVSSFVDFFYVEPFLRESAQFQSRLTLTPQHRIEMKLLIERIGEEYREKKPGYRILVKTRLIEMLVFLSRCYSGLLHKPMTSNAGEESLMRRIAEFIELHHASPLTLAQMSQMCDMSQSAFTLKFKQHIGKSFLEYRNDIRLETAKKLLASTDYTILRVSQEVGFDDLSFFNKLFKQAEGVTPGQFRRTNPETG
ncbi:AraC family transcriptional regulator [Paenibacillus ginsengarvi]|uniref:AraC family transcriptional regulator n=1 Tax=Paenibacillus ginsengarvi TaxID=400777 RepID=A0A3B0C8A1_9BACL|nr:AraC family transcriptional regulator [Paenibacillus ginsengarvi]